MSQQLLRKLYSDIIVGYTETISGGQRIFIKHFDANDQGKIDDLYLDFFEKAVSRGMKTEVEKLKYLIDNGLWKEEDEKDISNKKISIHSLKVNKKNLALASQAKEVQAEIDGVAKELEKKLSRRYGLMGQTAEDFATAKINELYIVNSLFKDKVFSDPFLDEAEFDEITPGEFVPLIEIYNTKMGQFTHENLKKIAISTSYQNNFSMSDGLYQFFGRPIAFLTNFQAELGYWGKFFQDLFREEKSVPPEIRDSPDDLLEWYNATRNLERQASVHKDSNSVSMNATKDDVQAMAAKGVELVSMADMLQSQPSKEQLMKMLSGG